MVGADHFQTTVKLNWEAESIKINDCGCFHHKYLHFQRAACVKSKQIPFSIEMLACVLIYSGVEKEKCVCW